VIQEIISISPTTKSIFIPLDLSSFSSIRAAAETITSTIPTFDVLINNAAIMGVPTYLTTSAGIESQFAQNHIGHFLLTNLLLPKLSPNNGRIVNIASIGYKFGPVRFEDYNFDNGEKYHPWHAYGQSKTANMLFSVALAKRGISSFSVQPGNVNQTNLMRYLPGEGDPQQEKFMADFMEEIAKTGFVFPEPKSLEQGCATSIVVAISTEIEGNKGGFLNDCVVEEGVVEYARGEENAERLWGLSEELVGEKFEF
jgi:NAD(P)-dependent dehydrogenase (short-subunit alcohol dehydrogenase family)